MPKGKLGAAVAMLLVLVPAACERARPPSDAPGADALTGEWSAELAVTQPLAGRALAADAAPARGTISLLRDEGGRRVRGLGGPATHVGARTLHLRPFGFDPRPPGNVPGVAARWMPPDSVELAFESTGPDETFTIRGRLAGDSIAGRWHYGSRGAGGASGSAVMRRATPAHVGP